MAYGHLIMVYAATFVGDSMDHSHLIMAYTAAFVIQLGYLGWVGLKYRATRALEREWTPPVAFPAPGQGPSSR
jgi:hypothetical protein